jgi:hypothetical protein
MSELSLYYGIAVWAVLLLRRTTAVPAVAT